jgi:phosphopantetheinyl transferase
MTPIVRVHCAKIPASLPDDVLSRWIAALPEPRCRALQSLTALALLSGLAAACRLPPLSSLRWSAAGKPHFEDGPEFSLTHSRGFAACAVAPCGLPVGIDLEPAGRARAAAVSQVAAAQEREALDRGAISPTELWTAKEAVLKAAGAGLADIQGVAVGKSRARFGGVEYDWRHFRPRPGLVLAVATRGPLPAVRIRWPSPASVFA